MQKLTHAFLMICFVLASVSPACAFVSGQHQMEICGADGSVRTMPIPEEFLAFLPDYDASAQQQGQQQGAGGDFDQIAVSALDDCAFCFAQSHIKPFVTHSDIVYGIGIDRHHAALLSAGRTHYHFSAYLSRAPPALFS